MNNDVIIGDGQMGEVVRGNAGVSVGATPGIGLEGVRIKSDASRTYHNRKWL